MEMKRIEKLTKGSHDRGSNYSNYDGETGQNNQFAHESYITQVHVALSPRGKLMVKAILFMAAIGCLLLAKAFAMPGASYTIIHDPVMYDWLENFNESINDDHDKAKAF